MASNITSAGSASGMDFESIISASLELKRTQLEKQVTKKKEEANIELSGVGKLKEALKSFQDALDELSSEEGFNTRKITTSQPTENPYFTVTAKDDASNGSYDIAVKQLASTEKVSQTFDEDAKIGPGTLKLTLQVAKTEDDGSISYSPKDVEINITEEMTISQLRRKINDQAGDLGISASIVETSSGQKLTIDTGVSGEYDPADNDGKPLFTMEYTASSGDGGVGNQLNYSGTSSAGSWNASAGKNAIITVDGEEVVSKTNTFNGQVSGLEITVNRTTANEDKPDTFDSYQLDVTQDVDAITKKVQNFISAYNTLMDTMDSLGERNTYTDGENNYDGGSLSGDSQLSSLQNQLQNIMSDITYGGIDAYSLGFELDKDGHFSLDSTKFKEGINDNFNAVVKMFSAEDDEATTDKNESGLITKLDSIVEEYTKSNGILDQRTQLLKETISDYEEKEAENESYLEQYEENLRAKYATLDTTIANFNNSLTYLQSVLG